MAKIKSKTIINEDADGFSVNFVLSNGSTHKYEFLIAKTVPRKQMRLIMELAAYGIESKVYRMKMQENDIDKMDYKIGSLLASLEKMIFPARLASKRRKHFFKKTRIDRAREAYEIIREDHADLKCVCAEEAFREPANAKRLMRDSRIVIQMRRMEISELENAMPAKVKPAA